MSPAHHTGELRLAAIRAEITRQEAAERMRAQLLEADLTSEEWAAVEEGTAVFPALKDSTGPIPRTLMRIPAGEGIAPSVSRRIFDVVASGLALFLLFLPLLVLYILVRLGSPGPGFFSQIRLGQGGQPFKIYKFRSMRPDVAGPEVTADADPRITRIGHVLRRTSLDELPQLWNVFKGDMTIVGVRPETRSLAEMYREDCRWVFAHRPGLTGASQVRMRDFDVLEAGESEVDLGVYINKIVPARMAVEAEFYARPTLTAAFGVMLDTARMILGRDVAVAVRGGKATEAA